MVVPRWWSIALLIGSGHAHGGGKVDRICEFDIDGDVGFESTDIEVGFLGGRKRGCSDKKLKETFLVVGNGGELPEFSQLAVVAGGDRWPKVLSAQSFKLCPPDIWVISLKLHSPELSFTLEMVSGHQNFVFQGRLLVGEEVVGFIKPT